MDAIQIDEGVNEGILRIGRGAAGHNKVGQRPRSSWSSAWSLLILRASTYITRDPTRIGASRSSHRNFEEPFVTITKVKRLADLSYVGTRRARCEDRIQIAKDTCRRRVNTDPVASDES